MIPIFQNSPNGVSVNGLPNGIIFSWSRKDIGFGELTLVVKDGQLVVDNECMNSKFCAEVIEQAIHEALVRQGREISRN